MKYFCAQMIFCVVIQHHLDSDSDDKKIKIMMPILKLDSKIIKK